MGAIFFNGWGQCSYNRKARQKSYSNIWYLVVKMLFSANKITLMKKIFLLLFIFSTTLSFANLTEKAAKNLDIKSPSISIFDNLESASALDNDDDERRKKAELKKRRIAAAKKAALAKRKKAIAKRKAALKKRKAALKKRKAALKKRKTALKKRKTLKKHRKAAAKKAALAKRKKAALRKKLDAEKKRKAALLKKKREEERKKDDKRGQNKVVKKKIKVYDTNSKKLYYFVGSTTGNATFRINTNSSSRISQLLKMANIKGMIGTWVVYDKNGNIVGRFAVEQSRDGKFYFVK
jgi:hypothetical protein